MTGRVMNPSGLFLRLAAAGCATLICASAWAADDPPLVVGPESAVQPEQTASESQNADAAALQKLTSETVAAMQQARAGFAEGPLNEESESLQAEILERLRRLSELVRQQSQVRSAGQSSTAGTRGGQASDSGDGQGAAGQNLDAADSSEAATGAGAGALSASAATRDLATSVWGHLPPRQRDRMQSRFSERFLPQYEELVRRYYEALATEEPAQK